MEQKKEIISLIKTNPKYPNEIYCFRPSERYPEYRFEEFAQEENGVYSAVRESFFRLGFDEANFGTPKWNPLSEIIKPGDNVLIKPNLVMDVNGNTEQGTECLYTQPSVVAPVIDYVLLALNETGKVIIGDAPMQECNFNRIVEEGGYGKLIEYYRAKGIEIELIDFRELSSTVDKGVHKVQINKSAKGTVIDLADESEFYGTSSDTMKKARITNYDPRILNTHHDGNKNEYYISDYVLNADVIINMPKPKSHRKAGATIALKNFVGANVRKEFLPHHTMGAKEDGGDEYLKKNSIHALRSKLRDKKNISEAEKHFFIARIYLILIKICGLWLKITKKSKYQEGSWYGNNTISKTISDINKIVRYSDKNGHMCEEPQRKMLIVADMIISGDKEGPVYPTAKPVGMIATGLNPVSFDRAIARLMGFVPDKMPTLLVAEGINGKYKLSSDSIVYFSSNEAKYNNIEPKKIKKEYLLGFEPSSGWKNHLEVKQG